MASRRLYRALFATLVFVLLLYPAVVWSTYSGPYAMYSQQADLPSGSRDKIAEPRDAITVVTSDYAGHMIAIARNGTLLYYEDRYDGYWDVDPSPVGERTVLVAATERLDQRAACKPLSVGGRCLRQMVIRVNLSTGERTYLYSWVSPQDDAAELHDVDRVSESKLLIADMYADEVRVVDYKNDIVEFGWSTQSEYALDSGGSFPRDWTHLNDIERIRNGTVMVSLRNQDSVVFIHPEKGLLRNWTLGSEDNEEILYEQHNPDYLPQNRGGPAVLVADSENDRVVEFQRTADGQWRQTWVWRDDRLTWPRDADRLQNGHTLITDTLGDRIVEVNQRGEPVWTLHFNHPYDAARLDTHAESTGGQSAVRLGLHSSKTSGGMEDRGLRGGFEAAVRGIVPAKIVHAIEHIVPEWVDFYNLLSMVLAAVTAVTWISKELVWSSLVFQWPIKREG